MILGRNQRVIQAAQHASVRHHYCNRPQSRVYLPPRVVRAGPAFALLVPATFTVETQAPESGLHSHASEHDQVAVGSELVLVVIVFLIVCGRVVVRILRLW